MFEGEVSAVEHTVRLDTEQVLVLVMAVVAAAAEKTWAFGRVGEAEVAGTTAAAFGAL